MANLIEQPAGIAVLFGLLFVSLLMIYKPVVFGGLDVQGSDLISSIGNTKQIKAFEEQSGRRPLWNPYMFGGTPIYHRNNAVTWSVDTLINQLDPLIDWRIWYLMLGALGMFLLLRHLKMGVLPAFMAATAFILIPHFHALIVVGHFSKFRALMWMPWVLLTFRLLLARRSLAAALGFALLFALQMRTQHYQIIFYTILLLFFTGIFPYLKMAIEKRWGDFLRFNALFVAAMALVVLVVAQPLFVTKDYTPYSTRGGKAVSLDPTASQQDRKGVGFDYATNWSYSLTEFWNLIIPKFHGGTSQERYTGTAVPQFRNRVIPTYWGDLPFTQSYEYLSVLLAYLALIGIVFQWKRPLVKSLTALIALALLLSLGKNFAGLYKLFFYYLPYFDKFRVPMMILTLVSFSVCLIAAMGLTTIFREGLGTAESRKRFLMLSGAFAAVLVFPLLFGSGFSLSPADEVQRYAAQYGNDQARNLVDLLCQARLEILKASAMRSLIFFLLGGGLLFWMGRQTSRGLPAVMGLIGMVLLVAVDLGSVTTSYLDGKFVDLKQMERQSYQLTAVDPIIQQDKSLYRVLPPLRSVANDSRWTYFYQSIGGYSAAKLQEIQDIISNNLLHPQDGLPFNLKVVSMLNGKYIVSQQPYQNTALEPIGSDRQFGLYLYRNREVLPRAFFVDSIRVITDGAERLNFMNSAEFDPAHTALLEAPLAEPLQHPDSASVSVTLFEPDREVLDVYGDRPGLLVISEVFYPKGWKATLEDGRQLPILKTNHILRAVMMPAGRHTLTMSFHPETYYAGVKASWIGWLLIYVGLAWVGYRWLGNRE